MSTNKKFRVQNGLDVTGEVTVGGVTVINADGTVVSDVSDQLVPLQSSVSALETAVQNIIGTSPETLDTLQEIVAAYEGADSDLQLLIATAVATGTANATAIAANTSSVSALDAFVGDGNTELPNYLPEMQTSYWEPHTGTGATFTKLDTHKFRIVNPGGGGQIGYFPIDTSSLVIGQQYSLTVTSSTASAHGGSTQIQYIDTQGQILSIYMPEGTSTGSDTFTYQNNMLNNIEILVNGGVNNQTWDYIEFSLNLVGDTVTALDTAAQTLAAAINELHTEVLTLSGADTSLTDSISANTTAISNEVTRATAAEQVNTDAIVAVQSQITNILSNTDSASLDSLSEIVAAFQAADSTLTGAVAANSAAHAQNASDISATNARTSGISTSSGSSNIQMTAEVDMDSNKVTNMADPTTAQDATTKAYVDAADASLQAQISAGSFDGSAIDQNLVPSVTDTYSLGTADKVWKDLYIGPGSLYLNGTKILEDDSGTITMNADAGQNLSFGATGGGSIDLNAGTESIQMKSDMVMSVGKTITTVGGAATKFGGPVDMQTSKIENLGVPTSDTDAATKSYVDTAVSSSTVSGDRTFDANVIVEGNLTVSGTTTTVNSETISLADNIIDLNSNLTSGTPSEHAGIRVLRGDESAVQVRWNETSDHWEVYNGTSWTKIALDTDDLAEGSTNLYFTDARARGCVSADDHSCIDYDETTGKFSLDVAETEAAITPDSAKDADKLDGQHGSFYRINVYDANGTLVN